MAADPGTFADPTAWINLGATGLFVVAFMTGKFYAQGTVTKLETERDKAVTAGALREDRLVIERDRALAERDEMIEVIKDFTHTAAAILAKDPTFRPPTRPPRRGGER